MSAKGARPAKNSQGQRREAFPFLMGWAFVARGLGPKIPSSTERCFSVTTGGNIG